MLTGTLDDFTLPDVLRLIAAARRTGSLGVERDAGRGELFFRDGTVWSSAPAGPEDLTFDLMRWSDGRFSWQPEPVEALPPGEAAIAVEDLLEHVRKRLEELAEIKTLVPSEEAVLALAPQPPEGALQISITPAEWRVLVMVDGHRPVRDIALAAGLDPIGAMRVLYGLAAAGLVTLTTPQEISDMPDGSFPTVAEGDEANPPQDPHMAGSLAIPLEQTSVDPPDEVPSAEPPAAEPFPSDPFLSEMVEKPADEHVTAAPSPAKDGPAPFDESFEVDRSTAARELAGLFDVNSSDFEAPALVSARPLPPPRRVEDDDQVTRGLINRLIDGVKGL